MTTKEDDNNNGLVKLADRLRNTLAIERQLAKEELGIYNKPHLDETPLTRRRTSVVKDKLRTEDTPRRRTLSNGASILPQPQRAPESNYMKTTKAADQQRRHSTANTTVNRLSSASPRKTSNLSRGDTTSPSITSEDEKPNSALKRRSILAAATVKARQQLDLANSSSSSDEPTVTRLRKKSIVNENPIDSILANRRMSRTENLKDGLPTSPTIAAARMARRKSTANSPSEEQTAARMARRKSTKKPTVRKRGKTLPGSLAKAPTVQSLQLPPMKLEPIRITIPQQKRLAPKSPSKRLSISSSSANTTPIPISSSSSSSAEAPTTIVTPPKKSISTRRAKGQSHLGISTSRRPSLKTPTSAQVVTPPLKNSPVTIPSPRVRPTPTRRSSLAVPSTKKTPVTDDRKLSVSGYSNGSRKNSVEETIEKDKGSRHRAISLKEKLEAMVAQHTIVGDTTTPSEYRPRKKSHEDDKYLQLVSAEERARPQRIKDSLLMWDKEMVEAFSPGVPKSPQIAIKFYGHHLSPYEQNEINNYPEVYFVGHQSKKYQAMPDNPALNYGYDDERGDYKSVTNDHLAYRYEILEELGRGSFGQVVKCYDHKTASTVAVKLIRNKKRFYAQARTEVKILGDLVKWDPEDRHHNVKMTDNFYFRNHLCIACECLSMNLYEFIKINNFQGFHITLIKRFTVQLLRSLSLLNRHGVVHCDLKPENILLKHPTKSTIKVIDFGSSCLESQRVYTYIQSRFYRSPEIILGLDYTMAIDMWSLGCIIAELYTGVPIFPGENEQEQLACIMEVLGVPEPALVQQSERRNLFFEWDPAKRLNPEKAFQHEWIQQSTRPTAVRPAEEDHHDPQTQSPKPTATLNDTNNYA
ncbi:kinase-like domain-containing protein [Mucor mucedo]|uniref:kinase-like domain-containing protein n=1 Tax=Mucor mucedo TaxID=29922 RepID=UPI00221ED25D|nr:kinase-like domain-containing protein [Mucor mucedo]KAI7873241.1 kinase-like domain-containing protein [Mucor mucedo]